MTRARTPRRPSAPRRLAAALTGLALLALLVAACGRYGPPVRTPRAEPTAAAAQGTEDAGEAAGEASEGEGLEPAREFDAGDPDEDDLERDEGAGEGPP